MAGRRNSLVHKRRFMVAVELDLNSTYAQHLTLKSVYEKNQYVKASNLFELAQGSLSIQNESDLNSL